MSWFIPVATMARLEDVTVARLIAGTLTPEPVRREREPVPTVACLTPDEWRARQTS